MVATAFQTRALRWAFAAGLSASLLACGDDDGSTTDAGSATGDASSDDGGGQDSGSTLSGEAYYQGDASKALGAANNEADCATCHSNDGSQMPLAGETLMNIAYLTSYKGGDAPTLLDAVNACVTGWMAGDALMESDPEWMALEAYLQSISDSSMTTPRTLMPEVLEDEAAYELAYAGGDAAAGESKYDAYCGSCHAGGLVVGFFPTPSLTQLATESIGRIAQQVRTSGPPPSGSADTSDSTPGPMPFFEIDDLTADDLKDIIAYIESP